jgi:hypothetical protein
MQNTADLQSTFRFGDLGLRTHDRSGHIRISEKNFSAVLREEFTASRDQSLCLTRSMSRLSQAWG